MDFIPVTFRLPGHRIDRLHLQAVERQAGAGETQTGLPATLQM